MNNKSAMEISSDGECGNVPAHTATPWSVYAEGLTIQIDEGAKPTGRRPCVIGWQGFDSNDKNVIENLANAALICKAVNAHDELVSALEDAQEELRLIRMKDSVACYDPTLRTRIACILARAKE